MIIPMFTPVVRLECRTLADQVPASVRIVAALANDAWAIYSGDSEPGRVPLLVRLRLLHPQFADGADVFGGWTDARRIRLLDFARVGAALRPEALAQVVTPATLALWRRHRLRYALDDATCCAIGVEMEDCRFEYVINRSDVIRPENMTFYRLPIPLGPHL